MLYKSVIDDALWDQAHWIATAFAFPPIEGGVPAMAFAFEHEQPALKIFQQWHAEFGKEDTDERIRIAIIEGEIPGQRDGYTVHLTTNPDYLLTQVDPSTMQGEYVNVATLCRFQRMELTHMHQGLSRFKATVQTLRQYYILPAIYRQDVSSDFRPVFELAILKGVIHFRDVREIAPSDIDAVVLSATYHA